MMERRSAALGIILCMLFTAACSEREAPVTTDTDSVGTDTTVPEEETLSPDIPDDLRFDGNTFRVFATPDANYGPVLDDFELEKSADVLTVALYERLINTEERFGIDIELNYGVEREILGVARASINSGSNDFDLVADVANWHKSGVYEGLYMPISELPYVDLDKPWWNKAYIESISVNPNNPTILFGAINLKSIQRSICTFFNIDMLQERKGLSEQDMYDMVLEGKWTLDKMAELIKDVYTDDGNTIADETDTYGYVHNGFQEVNWIAYSSGLEFTSRDEDGYPVLNLNNERSVSLADKLLELFCGDDTYMFKNQTDAATTFASGRSLFYVNRFFAMEWDLMRESDVNFGVIPVPKFDESVDNYYGAVAENTQWQMVPVTEPDPEFASAVIEYLAYDGYVNIIPAYYDITLKFKYTRGDLDGSSAMLDLIVENQRNDFMSVNSLDGMESIFYLICAAGQNNFASRYASYEKAANIQLAQYREDLG